MAEHGRQEQKIEILKNIIKENQHKSRITLLRTTSTNSANPEVHPQRIFDQQPNYTYIRQQLE